MSALYKMDYVGRRDVGAGALYVGKGKIVGIDIGNNHYFGTYIEQDGRLIGEGTIKATSDGGPLVTGRQFPKGSSVDLAADWPVNFEGTPLRVKVGLDEVEVILTKIGDIP